MSLSLNANAGKTSERLAERNISAWDDIHRAANAGRHNASFPRLHDFNGLVVRSHGRRCSLQSCLSLKFVKSLQASGPERKSCRNANVGACSGFDVYGQKGELWRSIAKCFSRRTVDLWKATSNII